MKIAMGQIFVSLHESGRVPYGWKPVRNSIRKVRIKNVEILAALRKHYPGEWKKVYLRGTDGTELHYFEHGATGKVWGVKVK
jgi:hypothetical protein